MLLQNNQDFTEMASNMIYIVALGVGLKFPRKIHLNTQCPGDHYDYPVHPLPPALATV